VADFEVLMQVITRRSIDAVLRAKATDAEYRRWDMRAYLSHHFPGEVTEARALFPETFAALGTGAA
jgi:hypothetical protein